MLKVADARGRTCQGSGSAPTKSEPLLRRAPAVSQQGEIAVVVLASGTFHAGASPGASQPERPCTPATGPRDDATGRTDQRSASSSSRPSALAVDAIASPPRVVPRRPGPAGLLVVRDFPPADVEQGSGLADEDAATVERQARDRGLK